MKNEKPRPTWTNVLEADLANILKKIKAGKPLNKAERDLVAARQSKDAAEDKRSKKHRIAASMGAAAAITKLPMPTIKAAKRAGCDAFNPQGSVDCDRLLEWLADNPQLAPDTGEPIFELERARKTAAERKIKEHEYAILEGTAIPLLDIKHTLRACWEASKRRLFAIPKRVSTIFAVEDKPLEIEIRLEKEIWDALQSISSLEWVNEDTTKS